MGKVIVAVGGSYQLWLLTLTSVPKASPSLDLARALLHMPVYSAAVARRHMRGFCILMEVYTVKALFGLRQSKTMGQKKERK